MNKAEQNNATKIISRQNTNLHSMKYETMRHALTLVQKVPET